MTCPEEYHGSCEQYIKDGSVSKMIAVAYVIATVKGGGQGTDLSSLEEYFTSYTNHCKLTD